MNFEQLTRDVMDKLGCTCGLWCQFVFVYQENMNPLGVRRDLYEFVNELKTHMMAKIEGSLPVTILARVPRPLRAWCIRGTQALARDGAWRWWKVRTGAV